MKISHFLLALAIFSFAACGDDDGVNPNILSYDGDNQASPELAPGTHELAVQFTEDYLADRIGKKLFEIEAFLAPGALSYKLIVHGPGTESTPGGILWEQDITSNVDAQKWVITKVEPLLLITGEDLWVGVQVVHDQSAQTIGCDSGPRHDGGDWIWSEDTQTWETFLNVTTTELVNWNIRGNLQD